MKGKVSTAAPNLYKTHIASQPGVNTDLLKLPTVLQILYALVEQALGAYDVEQFGVAMYLYQTGAFWTILLVCALLSFGHRLLERGYIWLFRPQVHIPHHHHTLLHWPAL